MRTKQTISTVLLGAALTAALAIPASAARIGCAGAAEYSPSTLYARLCGLRQSGSCADSNCNQLTGKFLDCFCFSADCSGLNGSGSESAEAPDAEGTPSVTPSPEADSGNSSSREDADTAEDSALSPAPDSSSETASVSAYEQEVVELVNEIRAEYGLSALTLSEQLCSGARLKSQDMQQNGYFSHESPTYGTPFQMMQSLGITYSAAAENIAMGQSTPQEVVTAWMNSESHRANILSDRYTKIGVGYVANGNYWTQWFVG